MRDSAGASRHYTKGKVLVGDKEEENGSGVLFVQHSSAKNAISTFRNAKAAG